jgi:branched-chain amino acid transport system ATP-binding protein
MLEVHDIHTYYGSNGAGKTTTLRSICGLQKPRQGNILLEGKDISPFKAHEIVSKGVAMVPEGRGIFARLTVTENLDLGAYTRRDRAAIQKDLERVFTIFPRLKERQRQVAGTLSGGEQQMLATGRALMTRPSLLLMDEPSMGLAPVLVEAIFDVIKVINQEGTTILLVEQNALMALSIANRGYVIQTGQIVLQDTADNLKKNDMVQKSYLGME